ncbi:MAG: hypothetical protein EBU46_01810 [Nitrosomonadaceae bacterium]|nr:hypothetical protein [Nitrosomonadaceae bacterium]
MRAEVEITLEGPNFPKMYPIGVSLNYTPNDVPIAEVELSADALGLICDFDRWRRELVTLRVTTTKGCIQFDGLVDGLSLGQTQGSMSHRLIIKNQFQYLKEISPKVPGLNIGSMNPFFKVQPISIQGKSSEEFYSEVQLNELGVSVAAEAKSPARFIVDFCLGMLDILENAPWATIVDSLASFDDVQRNAEVFRKQRMPLLRRLLMNIDTSAVDNATIVAAQQTVFPSIINQIQHMETDFFSLLVNLFQQFGCTLVVGNNKAFVVPDAGFLSQPHVSSIPLGQHSTIANVVYPAEFLQYSFNDSGYKDVKGVMVLAGANQSAVNPLSKNSEGLDAGTYVDTSMESGGMMVLPLPDYVTNVIDWMLIKNNIANTQQCAGSPPSSNPDAKDIDAATDKMGQFDANVLTAQAARQKILDNWAQLQYLQIKYSDRTGNISAIFDTGWAPGAMGILYTRNPGTYIDFVTTSINHSFQINGGSASAMTSIGFKCGRVGRRANSNGVASIEFYKFDYQTSRDFANKFIDNVTA